jgi:uncharacterized protein involved in type VI secretion and phage assembly
LGTAPNPSNSSPSTSANKQQSVIRTAAQNELTIDDTTGSENIYLHATKDWTIDIVNDKIRRSSTMRQLRLENRTRNVARMKPFQYNNRDKTVKDKRKRLARTKRSRSAESHGNRER